jgi:hypothetical protein
MVGIAEGFRAGSHGLARRRSLGPAAADGVDEQDVGLALEPRRDLFELDGM